MEAEEKKLPPVEIRPTFTIFIPTAAPTAPKLTWLTSQTGLLLYFYTTLIIYVNLHVQLWLGDTLTFINILLKQNNHKNT